MKHPTITSCFCWLLLLLLSVPALAQPSFGTIPLTNTTTTATSSPTTATATTPPSNTTQTQTNATAPPTSTNSTTSSGTTPSPTTTFAGTIRAYIASRPDLSNFASALISLGLFTVLLDDMNHNMTVFAPTNTALQANPIFQMYTKGQQFAPPTWHKNLDAAVRNHIVADEALSIQAVYNYTRLQSLYSMLSIDKTFGRIEQASVIEANITALNGYIHIVNQVIEAPFMTTSFKDLELEPEFGPDKPLNRTSLVTIVDFCSARAEYQIVVDKGLTMAGCRIRALNRINDYQKWTINPGGSLDPGLIKAEFLNASFINETIQEFIQYSLIPKNYYFDDLQDGYEDLIMPVPNCAHMFVTKHGEQLCFNNACTVHDPDLKTFLSSNGVGYVVDKCLVCPGVSMLAEYAGDYTTHITKIVSQYFISSEWNRRNLSKSVGDGGPITLFAAVNDGWSSVNGEDATRLSTDVWKPHQLDLLRHMMVQGNFTEQMLRDRYVTEKGAYNMTSLANQTLQVMVDPVTNNLTIAGGSILFNDIKGVDGMLQFTNKVPLPISMTQSVYEVARTVGGYEEQLNLIDSVFIRDDLMRLSPVTAMYAPNAQWNNKQISLQDIGVAVLENHIFKGLLWCKDLVAQAGTQMESENSQFWLVSVNADGKPCFDIYTDFGKPQQRACITKCDILARNGIVHEVDHIMLYKNLATTGPSPPIAPTFSHPTLPQPVNRPSASSAQQPSSGQNNSGPSMPVAFARPQMKYALGDTTGETAGTSSIPIYLAVIVTAMTAMFML